MKKFGLLILFLFFPGIQTYTQAGNDTPKETPIGEGPMVSTEDIEIIVSEGAQVQAKITAPLRDEYEGGEEIYPKGAFIELLNPEHVVTGTVKAGHVHFFQAENIYEFKGDVTLTNVEKDETIKTEVLYWDPDKKELFSKELVKIKTEDTILSGKGFTATEDLSYYKILKPQGFITINKED